MAESEDQRDVLEFLPVNSKDRSLLLQQQAFGQEQPCQSSLYESAGLSSPLFRYAWEVRGVLNPWKCIDTKYYPPSITISKANIDSCQIYNIPRYIQLSKLQARSSILSDQQESALSANHTPRTQQGDTDNLPMTPNHTSSMTGNRDKTVQVNKKRLIAMRRSAFLSYRIPKGDVPVDQSVSQGKAMFIPTSLYLTSTTILEMRSFE